MGFINDEFTTEDLDELRLMLSSIDEKIRLPENLKSKNLLHLLPEEEPKPVFHLWDWLTSKKALPLYSVTAVAVLAIMIVPSLTKGNQDVPIRALEEPPVSVSDEIIEEAADSISVPETDAVMPFQEQPELATAPPESNTITGGGRTGEYTDSVNDDDGLEDPKEPAEIPGRLGGDSPARAEDAEESSFTPAQKDPVTGGNDATQKDPSQPDAAGSVKAAGGEEQQPQQSPPMARSFGILPADSSYYIADSGGYSFYWRAADTTKTEESQFSIILEVKLNDADEVIYASRGMNHFYRIDNVSVSDSRVAVLGAGDQGLGITMFTGLKSGELKQEKTEYLTGTLVGQHGSGGYLYVFTSFTDASLVTATTKTPLPKSSGQGAFVVTIGDTGQGAFSTFAITGVPPMASYTFDTAEKIKVFYTDTDNKETSVVFQVEGSTVTLLP